MSEKLRGIAARYASGLRAVTTLAPVSDERKLERLRSVMRYGLGINHMACSLGIEERGVWDATEEEWGRFVLSRVTHDLGEFGAEDKVVGYVTHIMAWLFPDLPRTTSGVWAGKALDRSALDGVLEQFPALPGAEAFMGRW